MIWVLLLAILLLVTIWWFRERTLRRDLRGLGQALDRVGLNPAVRFYPATAGLGDLAEAFNRAARGLEARLQSLEADRSELAAILHNLADAVILLNRKKRLLRLNPAAETLFGVDLATVAERPYLGLIRDSLLDERLDLTLADGQPRVFTSSLGRGTERSFDVYIIPVSSADPLGVLLVIRDMTESHRLDRLRTELVSNVSHELRTPLTSIKGFIETLLSGAAEDPATRQRFLTIIATEAERLIRLTQDLLDLSRWDEGSAGPRSLVDLNQLATTEVQRFRERPDRAELRLETTPAGVAIWANPVELAQALDNLLDNALKYTPPDGRVTVRLKAASGTAELAVADTGPGIPAADLPRIFERFYRVAKDRSRQSGGSGLGLAIAKGLVEANGGRRGVESSLGVGSTFTMRLPLADMGTEA